MISAHTEKGERENERLSNLNSSGYGVAWGEGCLRYYLPFNGVILRRTDNG